MSAEDERLAGLSEKAFDLVRDGTKGPYEAMTVFITCVAQACDMMDKAYEIKNGKKPEKSAYDIAAETSNTIAAAAKSGHLEEMVAALEDLKNHGHAKA